MCGFAFDVVGDNTTSLSWCKHERVCSQLARRAVIGFALLAADLDASVADTRHIAGTVNVIYDGLSRGFDGPAVGLPAHKQITLDLQSFCVKYLLLCNPNLPLATIADHTDFVSDLLQLLQAVVVSTRV